MRRRDFVGGLGSVVVGWPIVAHGQQEVRLRTLGVLMSVLEDNSVGIVETAALRQGLAELGWVEGENIRIHFRWPGGDVERARALARELINLKPQAVLARSTPATAALKVETDVIPIVFVNVAEPLESGFVKTLARPGGNITGFTNFESSIGGRWLQLLKEVDPRIARVGVIYNPQTAPFAKLFLHSAQSAAQVFSVQIIDLPVRSDSDISNALTTFANAGGGGLVTIPDSFTVERRDVIIPLAARYRLPTIYQTSSATKDGGLMAFAVDTRDTMRRAAGYIDRILKGANPADLPVQQPIKFELSFNLKAAKALGVEIPVNLIATADDVIE